MPRYKLTIAYRGTHYHGWQIVFPTHTWKGPLPPAGEGLPTIQQHVTRVLRTVVHHPVSVVGSSRTDAGVHAKGQIAHFDTPLDQIPAEGIRRACNSRLPDDIIVRSIERVPDSFDAIASTASKRYQYVIWNSPDRPPFWSELCFHRWQRLDLDAMRRAAADYVGWHDFASFAKPGHQRAQTVRRVIDARLSVRGPRIVIGVEGTGFLWNQVRIMVGTLIDIGLGLFAADAVPRMLAACDRGAAGKTAPPQGLYLQWVKFMPEPAVLE